MSKSLGSFAVSLPLLSGHIGRAGAAAEEALRGFHFDDFHFGCNVLLFGCCRRFVSLFFVHTFFC